MSELQKQKLNIISQLHSLCAHCATGKEGQHACPIKEISARVQSINGIPLIVNSQFKGVLFPRV